MSQLDAVTLINKPIPLVSSFLRTRGLEETEKAIREVVCSVAFELIEADNAFRLLGPEMSYHHVDPYLRQALNTFGKSMTSDDILEFTSSQAEFDLCFEDSWTGYFVAKRFSKRALPRELVLIHLDDHTDMMSTLLLASMQQLTDPTSGKAFDPISSDDWKAAIYSGVVNIGNYITPLFYSGCTLHVRHMQNTVTQGQPCWVSRELRKYDLIPDKQFAAIHCSACDAAGAVGTYLGGSDPTIVLKDIPRAWTIVHVDLDYFINDFNGASRGEGYVPQPSLQTVAREKMDRFFSALTRLNPIVDRWLIATSPGFCSGYHWEFLLSELAGRISTFNQYAG
jgi:hypothetical protein